MECYLDNSATTRCLDSAAALMAGILCTDYGNPSSLHHKGVQAEEYVRHAREVIAKTLKVTPKEIFFTSGGTESDNLALRGAAYANARQGKHLITTSIEHPAILNTMQYLEQQGFEVTYLPVDENGKIRLSDLEAAIRPDTILVSIMHTNNEIGALEPIAEADISQCFRSCHNRPSFRLFKCQPHRAPRQALAVFPPVNPELLRQLAVSSGFQLIGKRQSGNRLKRISLKCNNAVPEMLLVVVFVEDSQ